MRRVSFIQECQSIINKEGLEGYHYAFEKVIQHTDKQVMDVIIVKKDMRALLRAINTVFNNYIPYTQLVNEYSDIYDDDYFSK